MKMQKKLEEYNDVNDLANDLQKNLDALATDLQNKIQELYNEIPDGPGIYGATGFTCVHKMIAIAETLERLNNYFGTNYEIEARKITNNDIKPVKQ